MNHNLSSSVIELIDQSEYEDRKILAASVAVSGGLRRVRGILTPPKPPPKPTNSRELTRTQKIEQQASNIQPNNSFIETSERLLKDLVPGNKPTILTDLEKHYLIFGKEWKEELESSILERYAQRYKVETDTKDWQLSLQKTYECLRYSSFLTSDKESNKEFRLIVKKNKEFLFAIELLRMISQVVGPLSEALLTPLSLLDELDSKRKFIEDKILVVTGEAVTTEAEGLTKLNLLTLLKGLKKKLVGQAVNLVDLLENLNDPKERGIYWAIFANPSEITVCNETNWFSLLLDKLRKFGGYEDVITSVVSSQEKYLLSMGRFFQTLAIIESDMTIQLKEGIKNLPRMLQLCDLMLDDLMIRIGEWTDKQENVSVALGGIPRSKMLKGIKIAQVYTKRYLACFAGGEGVIKTDYIPSDCYFPYTESSPLDFIKECEHMGMTLKECDFGTEKQKFWYD